MPSYFDFVRLRNALKADDSVAFAAISEYSSNAEVGGLEGGVYNKHHLSYCCGRGKGRRRRHGLKVELKRAGFCAYEWSDLCELESGLG